jgi:hypothetical protein
MRYLFELACLVWGRSYKTTARRTVFALMGAGLHGLNGVNPKVAIHLIQIYVMPRLLYGLEITTLRHNEINRVVFSYNIAESF